MPTPDRPRPTSARVVRRRRWVRLQRWLRSEGVLLSGLILLVAFFWALLMVTDETVPVSIFVIPLLVGGLVLSLRSLLVLVVFTAVALVIDGFGRGFGPLYFGASLVVGATAVVVIGSARSRSRLGVQGTVGESMLVDLRDRLRAQGELPELPRGWEAEVVHRSAGGATFSGDFLVASRSGDGSLLEAALVDVSGKGLAAGTRALLLSGAFGGLLGSLPPCDFLPAANAYLLRQGWGEGFATAIHLTLDLHGGQFEVRSAGHPPAIRFHAGSGRWQVLETGGALLGVFDRDEYVPSRGRLAPGDALMLYTDGLVETPRRDIYDGIDKLQGEAERLITRGFRHGARRLIDAVGGRGGDDDRALVLLWRT